LECGFIIVLVPWAITVAINPPRKRAKGFHEKGPTNHTLRSGVVLGNARMDGEVMKCAEIDDYNVMATVCKKKHVSNF
jgi:hypothetical protein